MAASLSRLGHSPKAVKATVLFLVEVLRGEVATLHAPKMTHSSCTHTMMVSAHFLFMNAIITR